MLWYGQNATEKTCVFGVNRPLGAIQTKDARFFPLRFISCQSTHTKDIIYDHWSHIEQTNAGPCIP